MADGLSSLGHVRLMEDGRVIVEGEFAEEELKEVVESEPYELEDIEHIDGICRAILDRE